MSNMRLTRLVASCSILNMATAVSLWKSRTRWEKYESVQYPVPDDEWFLQKLDHFDPSSSSTWMQRYQINKTWFIDPEHGPVFLNIGGEYDISAAKLSGMMYDWTWMDYAKECSALCFQLEHRFYGKSQPTRDLSVGSLRYLSSEQALADVAYFIDGMSKKYNLTDQNKWVVIGGSYAGALAAWARQKYPHLVQAALSSSGAVLAQADYPDYFQMVGHVLASTDSLCSKRVRNAFSAIEHALVRNPEAAQREFSDKFRMCGWDASFKKDVTTFLITIALTIGDTVQYNKQPTNEVSAICSIMANSSIGGSIDRLAYAYHNITNSRGNSCTYVSYQNWLNYLRAYVYAWGYQTCTEFGFYMTPSCSGAFSGHFVDLQFYVGSCQDLYGEAFDYNRIQDGVKRTNVFHGGKRIANLTNIVFVQGGYDPFRHLGVSPSIDSMSPVIVIPKASHTADLFPPQPGDSPELLKARALIVSYIKDFLSPGST